MKQRTVYTEHKRIGIGHAENSNSMLIPHYHDTYEIILIETGERNIKIENLSTRLMPEDLVLIEPYTLHIAEGFGIDSRRYTMNIYAPIMNNLLSNKELDSLLSKMSTFIVHLSDKEFDTAVHILDRIYTYFNRQDKASQKLMYCAIYEFMDFLSNIHIPGSKITHDAENNAVLKALQYVHNNYQEQVTLDFMAEYTNMSKSNFCLVFKKAIGETFADYLNHIRVSHVHRLLSTTNLSLNEIAERTGFSTASYMTSVFKKFNGITPGKLRKINPDIL